MKKKDLTGKRFGRLIAIERDISASKTTRWICKCDCGNVKSIQTNHLTSGKISSCGCLKSQTIHSRNTTHGMYGTKLYKTWASMKARCNNKFDKNYGGRGITLCEEWNDFEHFYRDMGNGYREGLSIDRIDVDGNYCKENCRWATKEMQANNTRTNRYIVINGVSETLSNVCKKYNLNYKATHKKLSKGVEIKNIIGA